MATSSRTPTTNEVLTVVAQLSGIPLDQLQSPSQQRRVGEVRAAAAHLLRAEIGLKVQEVAPLLGRSDQTIFEFSRKARLALVDGGRIAQLIEGARESLDLSEPDPVFVPRPPASGLPAAEVSGPESVVQPLRPPRVLPAPHLRHWRVRAGLSQAQLAQRSGIARETIIRIENGRPARRDLSIRLADALLLAPSVLTGSAELDALAGEDYRLCKGCDALRPLRAFVPVKGTPYFYLTCRAVATLEPESAITPHLSVARLRSPERHATSGLVN